MTVTLDCTIDRKHAEMALFVIVPAPAVAVWNLPSTITVEGTIDGVALRRRSLVRWDDARWFIELRRETIAALGKAAGVHGASDGAPSRPRRGCCGGSPAAAGLECPASSRRRGRINSGAGSRPT